MINVAIVSAVFPPEPLVSARLSLDLTIFLADNGAQATVLCPSPSRPVGAKFSGYLEPECVGVVHEAGVDVVRLHSFTAPESGIIGRMRESFSFGRHVCRYLDQHLADVDVVYANTWPLFSQALIACHCARRGIPLVLHIQDIYPESLLSKLPGLFGRVVALPLMALDRWTVRQSARVVVISENMRQTYVQGRGLAPEKVITIRNWVDESRFACLPAREAACEKYNVPENLFTFLYLGNIGPVAGVEGLIEAFHVARLNAAQLVIAGDGSAKAACVELAKRLSVSNIKFISDPDVENVPLIQSLGHIYLLPMRKGAGLSSIPSKLMAYLFSQRPVLATVDAEGDTARCIREANCGWVGEPENVHWLADKMAEVSSIPESALSALGQQGRAYGLRHFSKTEGVTRLGATILEAIG
ncbi:MAG: glycosyltransferase family 4 protein [Chloroflexota bacterium]